MENRIKKLLIGFLALMVVFTILSRAAAAAVVAKVQVDTIKSGNLTYEVSGTGIVKADAGKYIDLISGYKIGMITAKEGQKVKKGDLLFSYDRKQLKKAESDMEDELKKLQLQCENIGITDENTDNNADKEDAELALKIAKEDYKIAQKELKDVKKTVKESKEKEYKQAVSDWEDIKNSRDNAKKEADRVVTDKQEELSDILKPETAAKETLTNYKEAVKGGSDSEIAKAYDAILDYFYDGEYEEHQLKVKDSKKELERAQEDLAAIHQKWQNTKLNEYDQYDPDSNIRNAYYNQIALRKEEVKTAERAIEDAGEALDELTHGEKELITAITVYRTDIVNNTENVNYSETLLYEELSKGKLADPSKSQAAKTNLTRAEEDSKEVNQEWEKKLNSEGELKDKLQKDLKAMDDGSYDYSEAEKDLIKALQEAKRTLDAAKLKLKQIAENGQLAKESQNNQKASEDIERSILMVDINKKQKELEQLNHIISDKGRIYATVDGVVSVNELEPGLTITGQEKLVITTGGYELVVSAEEEDMKYFAAGDEISVNIGAGTVVDKQADNEANGIADNEADSEENPQVDYGADGNTVTSQIENIELVGEDGKISFTALLPNGNFHVGESLEFTLHKDSRPYNICIPIQALRQDTQGTYVLLVKEAESVLGTIDEAFRINVTVLSKDFRTAAIDAALTEEDKIITGSNRNFEEGDRVRIYEME